MRVTQIKAEGEKRGATVALTRERTVITAIISYNGKRDHTHIVTASRRKRLEEMARDIQYALDGYIGSQGDVAGYMRLIDMVAE